MDASPKQTIKVLVIDDDRERDEVYADFFSKYSGDPRSMYDISPAIPKSPGEAIRYLLSREIGFVVLDLRLDGDWGDESPRIIDAIRRYEIPVVLLSMDFNDPVVSRRAQDIFAALRVIPKLGFLPYTNSIYSHCRDSNGDIRGDVLPEDPVTIWSLMCAEAKGHGQYWSPKKRGEISFFHLTDTHFGTMKADLLNAAAIKAGAKDAGLLADFLLWSGDITERGLPSEFELAFRFITQLKEAAVLDDVLPVSVCPGNHDLCRPLALTSKMEWTEVEDESGEKVGKWVVKDTLVNRELWEYGVQPYREFRFRVSGEEAPLPSVGYRWSTQWTHHGFAILELPIEAHIVPTRSDRTPEPFVTVDEFNRITENVFSVISKASLDAYVCLIILVHGTDPDQPGNYAMRTEELLARIGELGHPIIVCGGHEHLRNHDIRGRKLVVKGGPPDELKMEGLGLPSVGYIKLSNLGTRKLTCEIVPLQKSLGDGKVSRWDAGRKRTFELSDRSGNWDDVSKSR